MSALRRQFFFSYAVIGSIMPLFSIFLWKEAGFGFFQISIAMALANVPMVLSPGIVTLMADRKIDSRRILAVAFSISAVVLSSMYFARENLVLMLVLFIFHGLAFVAMLPLQDGFFFSATRAIERSGGVAPPYPKVRVWGTVGFIVPSIVLFFFLNDGSNVSVILPVAVIFCLLSIVNSFTLPKLDQGSHDKGPTSAKQKLPTVEALTRLFSPRARFLCAGLALGYAAAAAYYTFISIYFREVVGIPESMIGLIICLGVFVEIFFTIRMPQIQQRITLKGIIVLGLAGMALRMILLAAFPNPVVAIAVQLVHGMEALALFVAPVMFLDRLAEDRFRNSIQGVFNMTIGGGSRIIGGLVAGWIAGFGLNYLLTYSAAIATAGMLIVIFFFGGFLNREQLTGSERGISSFDKIGLENYFS